MSFMNYLLIRKLINSWKNTPRYNYHKENKIWETSDTIMFVGGIIIISIMLGLLFWIFFLI